MKAWIYICAVVFAAGMPTALADETNTNAVAVPPPMATTSAPAPAVVRKVKPPAVVPLTQISTVVSLTTTNAITSPPMTTSTSAPPVAAEVKPPEEESLMPTSAVPAQANVPAAPPTESSGIGWKGTLAISVAILAVAGGLVFFMLRRLGKADHASLITLAMSESKDKHKDEDKDAGRREEKHEERREDKKETKKIPPPTT